MTDPRIDDLVTRLYRVSADIDDQAIRELVRNGAVALLRASDRRTLEHAVELLRSLLVTAAELRLLDTAHAQLLRDELLGVLRNGDLEVAVQH